MPADAERLDSIVRAVVKVSVKCALNRLRVR